MPIPSDYILTAEIDEVTDTCKVSNGTRWPNPFGHIEDLAYKLLHTNTPLSDAERADCANVIMAYIELFRVAERPRRRIVSAIRRINGKGGLERVRFKHKSNAKPA